MVSNKLLLTFVLVQITGITASDSTEKSRLHTAAQEHDARRVKQLLEDCHYDVDLEDADGNTPLHMSVHGEKYGEKTTNVLLAAGAQVNKQNKHGMTPLMNAVKTGDVLHADLLLKQGANVNLADKKGNTALYLGLYSINYQNNFYDNHPFPLYRDNSEQALQSLNIHDESFNNFALLRRLIKAGADVKAPSVTRKWDNSKQQSYETPTTPLAEALNNCAAYNRGDYVTPVRMLLAHGAPMTEIELKGVELFRPIAAIPAIVAHYRTNQNSTGEALFTDALTTSFSKEDRSGTGADIIHKLEPHIQKEIDVLKEFERSKTVTISTPKSGSVWSFF